MDQPLLSKAEGTEEEENIRLSPIRKTSSSSGYLLEIGIGQSRRRSATRLVTNDTIISVSAAPNSNSYTNLIANLSKKRKLIRRANSAPSVFTDARERFNDEESLEPRATSAPRIVQQAFLGLVIYIIAGVLVFTCFGGFKNSGTFKPVDGLYFMVVTLCTIGYGDIVPDTNFMKLFTCIFILVGFGFVDILLNGLVTYICDRQESVLLSTVDENQFNTMVQTYMIDKVKGRMRIRIKVCLALVVVIGCIAIGTIAIHFLECINWVDSFYLSVTSVTTVGYGDYSFTTLPGRCFAIIWLLISTLAVARAFLYLTELRIDKRNRRIAKWVLQKKLTLGDFVAADLDHDGHISKSEFVIYKLKEMGKITQKDILQICDQFDSLDDSNCGKITIADLMASD